jgi:hypothetical protein
MSHHNTYLQSYNWFYPYRYILVLVFSLTAHKQPEHQYHCADRWLHLPRWDNISQL